MKNSFVKSIFILATGSLFAQLLTVISAPFLTRLFSPEDLGVYTYVLSVATIFMSVINGRYDMSIVNEEREDRIYPLIKLSLIISFFGSLVIAVGYWLYILWFSEEYNSYLYTAGYIYLFLLSYGVINVLTAYNNRKKEYKIITSVYIIRTACQNIGAIFLGFLKFGLIGLLIPYTVGQLLGINRQAQSLKPHLKEIKRVKISEMLEVLKIHYKQPLFSAPAIFANSFSYSSITLFIGFLFGMSTVGYYSISVRLLGLPLSIISGNVSKVFFEEASREFNATNQFYNTLKKTAFYQIIIAIPMVIVIMISSPKIFGLIFGADWTVAGEYVVILAPMFGIRFIVSSISTGMIIANKQNFELILQIGFILASVVSFIVTNALDLSVERFLIVVSILFSIAYILYFIAVLRYSKGKNGMY
ncbi:lipopolysaccharide biosynthesis protein [Bacillus sp. JJ1609]|uniref:lipopolysaccharide biosynthesis protein n=1 Tax=Bacillus sp. JJ1609 TaxID=3122977 RepID=UPI002FFE56CA